MTRKPPMGFADAGMILGLVLVWVFVLYPALWIFIGSFRPTGALFAGGAGLTIDNYITIFEDGFGIFIMNSMLLCVGAVIIATFVSVLAAYAFSRLRFPMKRLILGFFLMGQLFPWIVLVTPLFVLFASIGLIDTRIGMLFCYVAISIPFSVYLLIGYLETLPRELDEAAIMDGCSRMGVIWRIVFPLMMPGIVATATYAFLLCWTEYLFALAFLTSTELKTIPLGLSQFFGESRVDWGAVMAASAVTTLPALLLFLPLQTRLTSGLAAGAVKG